jgi:ribokinase
MEPPREKKYIIVVCGGLNWDMITVAHRLPKNGETFNSKSFSMFPGGKGANAAIALHRLSHVKPETNDGEAPRNAYEELGLPEVEVHMVGSIGSDDFGRQMRESLARNFVNIDGVRTQEGKTSAVAITLVESEFGENRILVYPGANHLLKPEEFLHPDSFGTERPDMIVSQLELNRETVEQLIVTAKEAGIDTLLNPSPAHYLDDFVYDGLTHLILNETEAAIMSGREVEKVESGFDDWITITDEFLDLGVKNVVITLGAKGAFFSEQKGRGEFADAEKIRQDDILDTSGAGYVLVI